MNTPNKIRGFICIILGTLGWGFSGACLEYIFTNYDIESQSVSCIRLGVSAVIFLFISLIREKGSFFNVWKNKEDIPALAIYSVIGVMGSQLAYLAAVANSNAATALVLQTINISIIMVYMCIVTKSKPNRTETLSLILIMAGVFILATGGKLSSLAISAAGLFWGLANAFSASICGIAPRNILKKYDSITIISWAMIIAAVVLNLVSRSWNYSYNFDIKGWLAMAAIILIGSVFSYWMVLQATADIGPVLTSMLATLEPVSATVITAVWLGTKFSATDIISFVMILSTAILLAKKEA